MKGFPDLPPIWALGAATLSWALARFLPVLRFDWPWVSGVIFWTGLGLILWSAVLFWKNKTPIEPNHTPRALITEGPYRLNRNPIYTGLSVLLLGYALGQGALSALIPVIAFPCVITARFISREEDALRKAFGDEAERWIEGTRRW